MSLSTYPIRSWRRGVAFLARLMPVDSPPVCMGLSVLFFATAGLLLPRLEDYARQVPLVAAALGGFAQGWRDFRWFEAALIAAASAAACLFQARCLHLCFPQTYDLEEIPRSASPKRGAKPGIEIAGMPVDGDELCTSVLVTGVTGSAKTAGVLMPALAQLFGRYRNETEDELSRDDLQKLGAFIPEVKGDLVDGCIYLAHEAGRCVSRDVWILSPSCRIPVVRYRSEDGRFWFLSARGGSGGSDAADLLPRIAFPDGHPRAGRPASADVFESPSDLQAILPDLSRIQMPLGSSRPRFIGWRWRGEELVRVSHTVERDRTAPLPDSQGREETNCPPKSLTFDGLVGIDNGLHFNLVDSRLPAAEAAERIAKLASMARGGGERHGDNEYFYEQGRKLITACIALHREVSATPCTAADIVRLATQDAELVAALDSLEERLAELVSESVRIEEPELRRDFERVQIAPVRNLAAFFRDEWQKMVADGKTANVIKSTISGAFDVFLRDPNLAETFCRPSTFSFEDIAQSGKIIGLVPGDRYEQVGRLLGTACKMDFQSSMLSRNGRSDLNARRLVVYLADEAHKYVIAGSATAGDPYFMNLSRSNRVANLCATQSYAWLVEVIGREAANVYISAFGVQFWLQQTDPETCRRAAEICGTIFREKEGSDHNLDFGGLRGSLSAAQDIGVRRRRERERRERFRAEDFSHLNVGDIIAYNKGREGRSAKVLKGRAEYHFCTEKPDGAAAVSARVREYYREVIENLTHERGQSSRWDCGSPVPQIAPRPAGHLKEIPAFTLSAQQIERERADFAATLGRLDRVAGEVGGMDCDGIAVALEEARAQARRAPRPAEDFGFRLAAGVGGLVSDLRSFPAPFEASPEATSFGTTGSLSQELAATARRDGALADMEARSEERDLAPRPPQVGEDLRQESEKER